MDRIINIKVGGYHLSKDSNLAGVCGSGNAVSLCISFDAVWKAYAKKIVFWNARGLNPVERILTIDLLREATDEAEVYMVPIPAEPLEFSGNMTFVIEGYTGGNTEGKRARCVPCELEVEEAPTIAGKPADVLPDKAEQLQLQIDTIVDTIHEAVEAEAAVATMKGEVETARDEAESAANNAKAYRGTVVEYAKRAEDAAKTASDSASDAVDNAGNAASSASYAEGMAISAESYANQAFESAESARESSAFLSSVMRNYDVKDLNDLSDMALSASGATERWIATTFQNKPFKGGYGGICTTQVCFYPYKIDTSSKGLIVNIIQHFFAGYDGGCDIYIRSSYRYFKHTVLDGSDIDEYDIVGEFLEENKDTLSITSEWKSVGDISDVLDAINGEVI